MAWWRRNQETTVDRLVDDLRIDSRVHITVKTLNIPVRKGWNVRTLAFSPDGETLGIGGEDGTQGFWDAQSGAEKLRLQEHKGVEAVAFSASGRTFVSGGKDTPILPASLDAF